MSEVQITNIISEFSGPEIAPFSFLKLRTIPAFGNSILKVQIKGGGYISISHLTQERIKYV